jgi:nitrate reductase gamma subunit
MVPNGEYPIVHRLPLRAVFLAVFGSIYRYFTNRFSYSSISSQLIEKRSLFWGAVPWHYGVIPILIIHLLGFTLPGVLAVLHGNLNLLYVSELFGKVLTLLCIMGIIILIIRRLAHAGLRLLTTPMDWVVLVLLLNQIVLGFITSVFYRWGAPWFLHTVTPWVASLATFRPEIETVTVLPLIPRLHFLNATLLIAIFPFSRLVHMVTFPITYLWRRYQVFIWNRRLAQ